MKLYRLHYCNRAVCDNDFDDMTHFYEPANEEPSLFFTKEEMLKYAGDLHKSWVDSGLEPPALFMNYLDDDGQEVTERYQP